MKKAIVIGLVLALFSTAFAVLGSVRGAAPTDFQYTVDVKIYNTADDVVNVTVTKDYSAVIRATPYWEQIQNAPSSTHAFQVVRDVGVHAYEANIAIDGQTWKYLAYDSDQNGNGIRLYMSNDLKTWAPYSNNPILSGTDLFRWPNTIYYDGTFYMFVNERQNSDVVLYTSTDGIHYTKQNVVLTGNTTTNNPYIYLNPNDNKFYLYNHQAGGTIAVKIADTIDGLASATNNVIFTDAAAPSVMYYDGYYYMFVEKGSYSAGWYVEVYRSTSPTSGFSDYMTIATQTDNEACPTVAYGEGYYFLFTNHYYGTGSDMTLWSSRERYLTFSLKYNGTKSDYSDIAFFSTSGTQLPYNLTSYNANEAHFLVNISGTNGNIIYAYGSSSYTPQYTDFPTETAGTFSDDFESGTLDKWDYVGSDWSVKVDSDNHYAFGNYDSGGTWVNTRLKKIINATGVITVEADVQPTVGTNTDKKVSIKATINSGSDTLYLVEFTGGGTVKYYNGAHNSWPENATFGSGNWVHMKLVIDTTNSIAQLWLGSNYCGQIPLQDGSGNTVSGAIYDIWFESSTTTGYTLAIDNVAISTSSGAVENTYPPAQVITPIAISTNNNPEEQYTVTFQAEGISNLPWSVTIGENTYNSNTNTIVVSLPNGTYSYTVNPPDGYSATPESGSFTVNGADLTVAITFTSIDTGDDNSNPYKEATKQIYGVLDILIPVLTFVAVLVIIAKVFAIVRKSYEGGKW